MKYGGTTKSRSVIRATRKNPVKGHHKDRPRKRAMAAYQTVLRDAAKALRDHHPKG